VRSDLLSEFPLKKLGWLKIASSQPVLAIPVKLAPVIIGITVVIAIITMPAVPIRPVIGTIIRSIIPVRIIGTVRVISAVIARTEPDTEVNLSIRTRRPCDHQTPGHDCNQQKFLHDFTSH
jgi:hypothetical protein